jgi:hypothetical protein
MSCCVCDTPGLSCVYRFSFQFVLIFLLEPFRYIIQNN